MGIQYRNVIIKKLFLLLNQHADHIIHITLFTCYTCNFVYILINKSCIVDTI